MLRLMSARQIQAIHFPDAEHGNEQAATRARQRVLARLTQERLLIRLDRRVGGVRAGSAGFVLALGPVGQRILAGGGRRRSYEPTLRFFDHTLAVAQLVDRARRARKEAAPTRTGVGSGGRHGRRHCFGRRLESEHFGAPEWTRTTTGREAHKALNLAQPRYIGPLAFNLSDLSGLRTHLPHRTI